MTEAELYKELGILTKDKDKWREAIPYVLSLLSDDSAKIQAKALWLLGEMGLVYPQSVQEFGEYRHIILINIRRVHSDVF